MQQLLFDRLEFSGRCGFLGDIFLGIQLIFARLMIRLVGVNLGEFSEVFYHRDDVDDE